MLSKKAKYAIKALVFIAKNIEKQPIPVSKIAVEENIPLKFLESILTELKNVRILNSKKGKNGGYSLNESPDEIHMAKIIRLFDGAIALLPCATYKFYERCDECHDEQTCGIRNIAIEIRNETVKKLKKATLSEIIQRENKLKQQGNNENN
ncbi:RrF2 family transcriptional regulator [Aureibacter tunicatorum]|uniref:Rrf2 family protein n=1 Tax=Aureibacter tunicatorum TaxID=866807 RepID=A0AAE3XP02_9BACT|nr:Rrf2 family transcriptional regulator [Aureibacter tunicatorum]MDR6241431.1 Rrf2 family protein [Aureibacter tunicatorum]BDD06724.1 Rrf2 family transcriptional regulator [Aureibacter tunicatorum]